jgi:hypothetical protein
MEVKLETISKGKLEKVGDVYYVYYNNLAYKEDSTVVINLLGDFDSLSSNPGCKSCTTTKDTKTDFGGNMEIKYDTANIGNFEKIVTLQIVKNKIPTATTFRIVGTVNR